MTGLRMLVLVAVGFAFVDFVMWLDRRAHEIHEAGEELRRRKLGSDRPFKMENDRK